MQVVAARDIGINEEITVTYGDNYFGEGNCECLCMTCENAGRGAWAGAGARGCSTPTSDDEGEQSRSRSLRRLTRKRSRTTELSESLTPRAGNNPYKRRKTRATEKEALEVCPDVAAEPSDLIGRSSLRVTKKRARPNEEEKPISAENGERSCRKRTKVESSAPCTSPQDKARGRKIPGSLKVMGYHTPENPLTFESKDVKPPSPGWKRSTTSPVADSIYDQLSAALKKKPSKAQSGVKIAKASSARKRPESAIEAIELMPPASKDGARSALRGGNQPIETPISSSDQDSLFDNSNPQVSSPATTPGPSEEPVVDSKLASQHINIDISDGDLSELDPHAELDDESMTVMEKSPKRKRAPRGSKILPTIEVEDASLRITGDYTRTPLLLGEKYSRWVDCRTCLGCWVQQNGYQTRKECPRCERHSKLYGYQWPKTDKWGKDDEEERVMDHRTVHRFVRPEEERLQVKRGKGCVRAGSESTSRTHSTPGEVDKRPISRLRESARVRRCSQLRAGD